MDPRQRDRQLLPVQAGFCGGGDKRSLGRVADYPDVSLLFNETGVIVQQADGQKQAQVAVPARINCPPFA